MKAVSGKFHPLFQWFYFDSAESLPSLSELTPETCAPQVSTPALYLDYPLDLTISNIEAISQRSTCAAGISTEQHAKSSDPIYVVHIP